MELNFQEIVLRGHFRPIDRDLSGYFYREFRKSELYGYNAPGFFKNCLQTVKFLKVSYISGIKKRAKSIEMYIDQHSNPESDDIIAYKNELEELKLGHFKASVTSYADGMYPYSIGHCEISNIEKAIIEAFKKATPDYDIWIEKHLQLDPPEYLQSRKAAIISKLTEKSDAVCANTIYDALMAVVQKLNPLRESKSATQSLLEEAIKDIYFEPETVIIDYLLLATCGNDTYCYAYNFLAETVNRGYIFPFDVKNIAEHELSALLEQENIPKNEDSNAPFSASKLKKSGSPMAIRTFPQIALKYAWEGKIISKQNCLEIARNYGYKSGSKLLQIYCRFMRKSDRIADPDGSVTIMKNKIKLFESVIEMLSLAYKSKATEELNTLREIFEKTYLKKDI